MDGVSDRRKCTGRQKVRMGCTSDSDSVDVLDRTQAEKHRAGLVFQQGQEKNQACDSSWDSFAQWMKSKDAIYFAMLSHFSRVRLCATPQTAAHQGPLSLGFSRQEHCSGLPFPSPVHESEKWKWSCSVVSNSLRPHGLQPTRLLHPWDFPGKSTGVGCHCLLRNLLSGSCKFIF